MAETYYRGRDYECWTRADGSGNATFGLPTWVCAPNGSYVPYIYNDKSKTDGYYEIANGLIGCRIYPYYAVLLDPEFKEIRVYMEQWSLEQYNPTNKKWSSVITPSSSLLPTKTSIVTNSSGVFLTQSYSNWGGQLDITYALREGCPLKHSITFKSAIPEATQFRVLMFWSGIVGNKVQNQIGTTTISSENTIDSKQYSFLKADGSLSVSENLLSSIQFNQPAVIDVHAQGMKATFTFQNATMWTVAKNGVVQLDPDTYTFQPATIDNYLDSDTPTTNYGSAAAFYVFKGADNVKRPILKFDMSGTIPAGATINSATLSAYCFIYLGGNYPSGRTYTCKRVTQTGWTSSGSTWNKYDGTNNWASAGGDYTDTDAASASAPTQPSWTAWTVTAQVQTAVNSVGRVAHFIIGDFGADYDQGAQYRSSDYTGGDTYRPKLYVDYTIPTITITLQTSPAGCNVRLDGGSWFTAPHQFTGITPGSSHSVEAQDPYVVAANQERYVWASWSDSGANPHNVAPAVDTTYTATMTHQWYVTITSSGIAGDSSGTVATLDGQAKTQAQLPYSAWFNNAYSLAYSFSSPVSGGAGKQYTWSSTSGLSQTLQSNTFSVTTYGTITGTYGIQYYLTVNTAYSTQTGQGWYNSGATAYAGVSASPVSGGAGTRYVFTSWSGDASGTNYAQSNAITMSGAKTATAGWKTQYSVTITSSGIAGDSSGTVATLGGNAKTQAQLPYTDWFDAGSLTYAFSSPVASSATKQYVWSSTSGLNQTLQGNTFTLSGTGTITGTYTVQWQVTIDAIIVRRSPKEITIDAQLVWRYVKSITADSRVVRRTPKNISVDALLKTLANPKSFTVDAVILLRNSVDITLDAVLQYLAKPKSWKIDALLKQLEVPKSFTADAQLRLRTQIPITVDAILHLLAKPKTWKIDALLKKLGSPKDFTADARLVSRFTKETTVDAMLKALEQSKTFTLDAVLLSTTSYLAEYPDIFTKLTVLGRTLKAVRKKRAVDTDTRDSVTGHPQVTWTQEAMNCILQFIRAGKTELAPGSTGQVDGQIYTAHDLAQHDRFTYDGNTYEIMDPPLAVYWLNGAFLYWKANFRRMELEP